MNYYLDTQDDIEDYLDFLERREERARQKADDECSEPEENGYARVRAALKADNGEGV